METKKIFSYVLQGTAKQLEKMYELMDYEDYYLPEFHKYFHVWVHEGTGVYYFPKEKYFVSRDGETNYAVALLNYGGKVGGEVYAR